MADAVTTTASFDPDLKRLLLDCIDAGIQLRLVEGKVSVRAPRSDDVAPLIDRVRSHGDDLRAYLAADEAVERRLALGPIRHPDNDAVLSSGQERLWFVFQYEDDPTAYNMFGAYRVFGDFSYAALDAALQAIMFRHQVFRSYVDSYDGELVQKFAPVSRVHIPVDDLTDIDPAERDAAVTEWLEAEAAESFELSTYPLWRFRLVKVADDEHIFSFSVHHIICDGLSELVLLGELDHWYGAFVADPETKVPETKIRYCDYAAWQKSYLGSMRYLRDLAFWRRTLADAPPMLQVPTDRPRPVGGSNAGGWINFRVEQETTEQLWQIGRDAGTTTFMVGLTLFGMLLSDFSGQDDLVIGTPVSNRNHPDLEELVGFFVNSVPLRLTFDSDAGFADAVAAVSRRALDSFDHQGVPLEHLVDELGVRRDASHNPIFQAMFAMEDADEDDGDDELSGLRLGGLDVDVDSSMFDLDLLLTGHPDGHLDGGFNYNSDLYDEATIERMCERFRRLAVLAVADPTVPLRRLRELAADDADSAVGIGRRVDYDLDTTLDQVIAQTMARQPDVVAVEHNGVTARYRDLDRWADTIATELRALGVRPGELVTVEAARSIAFLAALLGIHRAGAAYVPIDPEYPDDRRQYMNEDSGAAVRILDRPPVGTGVGETVMVTVGDTVLHLENRPEPAVTPDPLPGRSPLAYMIYTSGSTGAPKGATVRHDGALNHIHAEVDALDVADDFVFLQTAASSSDISVWQFFGPLVYGGRTVIVDTHTQLDPAALFALARASQATVIELVPSVVQLLCEHADGIDDRSLPALRCLLITGEAAPVPVVNHWLDLYPDVPVVNAYGPTEAADDVCQAVIAAPLPPETRSVPIGRPLANLDLYVLDADLNPVPRGAAGEICVAGVGVGGGYHRKPDRTAAAFVTNPFATGERDAHLYRTGDLGRWLPDGQLDFLGRVDEQVKVRGFRLELGEITACVVAHPSVREAATTLITNTVGDPLLVAYYSVIDEAALEPDELRDHLKTLLPTQIVPNACVFLDRLPHLPNGKVDTRSLPDPESVDVGRRVDAVVVEELDELGREIHEIWCSLLGVSTLAADADFFDNGGHSLLAVRLLAQIKERFTKHVSIADFFAEPRFEAFCRLVAATEVSDDAVELVAAGADRYPLSPGQARLWFLDLFESDSSTYNMPGALRFRGDFDLDAFNRVISALVARHPSLRTRIDVENGSPYQEILPATDVVLPVCDLSERSPEAAEAGLADRVEALVDTEFVLAEGPLWHFEVVRAAADDHYLLSVAHHIITDGLSNELIIGELVTLYACFVSGLDNPLPPLELCYGDYAQWQLDLQSTNHHRRQQLYWERKLAGAPALLDLPTDRPRPATQTYDGDEVSFSIEPEVVAALRRLAGAGGATMFMVLTAATAAVLGRYSGQDDVVVGTPIGGRPRAELESIVGFFVNTIVLRVDTGGDQTFEELLAEVRATAIEAFDHRDVPFEQIVERAGVERNPSFSPIFQVMVAYEEDTGDGDDLVGIDVDTVEIHEKAAMFDLDLLFDDEGDELSCDIVYNTDLFDRATVEQFGRHLARFLSVVTSKPSIGLDLVELLDEADLAATRRLEAGPSRPYDLDRTLHGCVAASARRHPERVAAVDSHRAVTYAELAQEVGSLTARLADTGVGAGDFVAIVDDRRVEFLVAILASMTLGAAYVPVDPTYPGDRIATMIDDSAARVIVTSAANRHVVTDAVGADDDTSCVVLIDDVAGASEPVPGVDADEVSPGDAAYMIYTSGSTGTPKGAVVSHRAQLNHILAEADALGLADGERSLNFAQTAPASSDISVWQFLAPVVLGGTSVIIDPETLLHPDRLLAAMAEHDVSLLELVPAVFDHVLDHVDRLDEPAKRAALATLSRLDAAMITGEAAPVGTVNRWIATVPGVPLVNAYGPTEAADDICQHTIEAPLDDDARSVPIGRPLANLDVYVLDDRLRRVPNGVRGEICVAGVGVGEGYWRRPERTAESFVANPHSCGPDDAVLYRTGDQGRWRRDGTLEFLGRADSQVNLLGMRLELGEIESALNALVAVAEAAVIVTEQGARRLVAFWVPAPGGDGDHSAVADELRTVLPTHMVPTVFVELQALPRNPAGKVDHGRLPTSAAEANFAAAAYVAPSTDDEASMTELWSVVLDVEQVSVTSDFFELGGNSLLAVQMVREIALRFDVELPLVEFFRRPTVSEVLAAVHRAKAEAERLDAELDEVAL